METDVMKLFLRLAQQSANGFSCAQILMATALQDEEKENPDLLRAVGGLNMGYGYNGGPCGALTGGCCMISYYAGKGEPEELEDPNLEEMLGEYARWFNGKAGGEYGGNCCDAILDGDKNNKLVRCPMLIQECYLKVMEILRKYEVL